MCFGRNLHELAYAFFYQQTTTTLYWHSLFRPHQFSICWIMMLLNKINLMEVKWVSPIWNSCQITFRLVWDSSKLYNSSQLLIVLVGRITLEPLAEDSLRFRLLTFSEMLVIIRHNLSSISFLRKGFNILNLS